LPAAPETVRAEVAVGQSQVGGVGEGRERCLGGVVVDRGGVVGRRRRTRVHLEVEHGVAFAGLDPQDAPGAVRRRIPRPQRR
jgi:hypothetical protein